MRNVVIGIVVTLALVATGCSASTDGGSSSGPDTTHAPAPEPTVKELEEILPRGKNLEPDFTIGDASDDASDPAEADDPLFDAVTAECPAVNTLMDTESADPSSYAARYFDAPDGRQIAVFLVPASDPLAGFTTRAEFEKLLAENGACEDVTASGDGADATATFRSWTDDTLGDFGGVVAAGITYEGGQFERPLTIHTTVQIFRVGQVDVMVQSTSGVDENAEEVPVDRDQSDEIAADVAEAVRKLQESV